MLTLRAKKLTTALSTFTVEAELEDVEQRIEIHVGGTLQVAIALIIVDEVAGGGTKIDLVPNLDYETHFEDIEVSFRHDFAHLQEESEEEEEDVPDKSPCNIKKPGPSRRSPSPGEMRSKSDRKPKAESMSPPSSLIVLSC
jgi:hypothetical protein